MPFNKRRRRSSYGYAHRRRRYSRTQRRRRRIRREGPNLDRLFGLGQYADIARRISVINAGRLRAQREQMYQSPLQRMQLTDRLPTPMVRRNRLHLHRATEPRWIGTRTNHRTATLGASIPSNAVDPAIAQYQGPTLPNTLNNVLGIPVDPRNVENVLLGNTRLSFFN